MAQKATRNKTIQLCDNDRESYKGRIITLNRHVSINEVIDKTICQDISEVLKWLPAGFVDLVFADPPYNINKTFNKQTFNKITLAEYEKYIEGWMAKIVRLLKPTASVYICGDWRSSGAIEKVASKYFIIRNRITWEREKGRGAKNNWKNCCEDIWFCTLSDDYKFNLEAVKLKRQVLAPYKDNNGKPKDWEGTKQGRFRITHPSNIWTDLTVPFWSMSENTNHPTQKPEKLLAKIILANSDEGDIIFDPFLGSGTTSVVAKKLGRHYVGIERDETYCLLAEKRLHLADRNGRIQGYSDGFFWERNTFLNQRKET